MRRSVCAIFIALLASLAARGFAEDAQSVTGGEAKQVVLTLLDSVRENDLSKFRSVTQPDVRVEVGPPGAIPPAFKALLPGGVAEAFKGCEVASVSQLGEAAVAIETKCEGKDKSPTSYFVLRDGKVALFYPFMPPIMRRVDSSHR